MLERLDHAFDAQRRFVANASHELRTPLAINRAMLEVAATRADAQDSTRQLARNLLAVNARHAHLIEGLLALADSDNPPVEATDTDLAELTRDVLDTTDLGGIHVRDTNLRPALRARGRRPAGAADPQPGRQRDPPQRRRGLARDTHRDGPRSRVHQRRQLCLAARGC
jgi:signal transduction histidine kinase